MSPVKRINVIHIRVQPHTLTTSLPQMANNRAKRTTSSQISSQPSNKPLIHDYMLSPVTTDHMTVTYQFVPWSKEFVVVPKEVLPPTFAHTN